MEGLTVLSLAGVLLCAASFLAGLIDAISGGGGLISLPTFMAVGFPAHYIMGTSQCSTIPGCVIALIQFALKKKIHWPSAIICIPACMVGAFLGARLNIITPEHILRIIMIVLVPIVAVVVLSKHDIGAENRVDTLSPKRLVITNILIGLILGTYQGFYGAGSGTFLLLAFALADRLDLVTASGNVKAVVTFSSVVATATYVAEGLIAWDFVVAITIFNAAGAFFGARLALTKGAKVIRPMFIAVLTILFLSVAVELITNP
ncbi:MAG: sulfite exporter TauE/SafE family protein [Coriobacteriales bacterium]|nr:sulfite exporter TauE/SafE family protein [Coriobacteriales bacterium]